MRAGVAVEPALPLDDCAGCLGDILLPARAIDVVVLPQKVEQPPPHALVPLVDRSPGRHFGARGSPSHTLDVSLAGWLQPVDGLL